MVVPFFSLIDLDAFINEFDSLIFEEHLNNLILCRSAIEKVENIKSVHSIHGCHYENCIWASDDAEEGPDTCACVKLIFIQIKCHNLMLHYRRLFSIVKSSQI